MKLHYRNIGEGEPLIILHGLFGSADNWLTLGKKFAENFSVYFVDQRNHGHSPHTEEFNYELMAEDLYELITDLGLSQVNLLGHSMGGKTCIEFAKHHSNLIKKMIVVDISQKAYPLHHDALLDGMNNMDLSIIKSRSEADVFLSQTISDVGVRQFLLKNLYWIEPGQLAWRINLPVLSRKISEIVDEIKFDHIDVPTLFIRGGRSNYILESDYVTIRSKFASSEIFTIEEAGHWVHAEAPSEFYTCVMNFLS
jgi:pimeloyl-ACP methyl ester carboxylesterase